MSLNDGRNFYPDFDSNSETSDQPTPSPEEGARTAALTDLQHPDWLRKRILRGIRFSDGYPPRDGYPTPREERILERIALETGFSPSDYTHKDWDKVFYTKWKSDEVLAIRCGLYKFKGNNREYGKPVLPFPHEEAGIVYDVHDPKYKGFHRKLLPESHPLVVEQKRIDNVVEREVKRRLEECKKILEESSQRKSTGVTGTASRIIESNRLTTMKSKVKGSKLEKAFWKFIALLRGALLSAIVVVLITIALSLGYFLFHLAGLQLCSIQEVRWTEVSQLMVDFFRGFRRDT